MKTLLGYGFRVQKSVFECYLSTGQLERLSGKLQTFINPKTDSIRIYPLTAQGVRKVQILGVGEINEQITLIVV